MYINITDSKTADNKGSSRGLVHYLEKENRIDQKLELEYWFNHTGSMIEPYEVRQAIDGNVAKLRKSDAKFFLINISPSQKELRHLSEKYGEMDIKDQLKFYTERLMDEYAKNFKREGINSAKDLVWFGKIENHRYYGYKDKEVINGEKKRGERKEGNQMHIQVIVSRKDATNRIKLSPMNNSRGKNEQHSKKLGQFDRIAFKQCGEEVFDKEFKFDRQLKDKMAYANIQKNGTIKQKEQIDLIERASTHHKYDSSLTKDLFAEIADHSFSSLTDMVSKTKLNGEDIFGILLAPSIEPEPEPIEKKRKRKSNYQSKENGLHR